MGGLSKAHPLLPKSHSKTVIISTKRQNNFQIILKFIHSSKIHVPVRVLDAMHCHGVKDLICGQRDGHVNWQFCFFDSGLFTQLTWIIIMYQFCEILYGSKSLVIGKPTLLLPLGFWFGPHQMGLFIASEFRRIQNSRPKCWLLLVHQHSWLRQNQLRTFSHCSTF